MSIVDLSCAFPEEAVRKIRLREVPLKSAQTAYTGMVYDFEFNSMDGSYLDLPGHIRETDDGQRADNVSAAELEAAFGGRVSTPALMINALGTLEPDQIEQRSVWLDFSALDWMISCGVRLLVSDIFESQALEGVFLKLFQAGISTVCEPRGMSRIRTKTVELTVQFPRFPGLTQIPCRILAEEIF